MKHLSLKFNRLVVYISFIVIVVLATVGVLFFVKRGAGAATPQKPAVAKTVQPQFTFSGATGWHKGPTNETSMALFRNDGECFTSIEHKSGTVEVAAEIQKQQSMMAGSGNTMTAGATPEVLIQTTSGPQQYKLHEFSLASGDKSHPLMGGLGLGYVQQANGYLKIQSHCNTEDELATTIPALQSYNFHMN